MDDRITAAAFRRAFQEADDLAPLVLPDGEVVSSLTPTLLPCATLSGVLRGSAQSNSERAAWDRPFLYGRATGCR